MTSIPTGTVTFLFTDIEGSTRLAQAHPAEWEVTRQRHHAILRAAADAQNGYVFQTIGDAFCLAFHNASDAVAAAIAAQRALQAEAWGEVPVKVRMGLHTGAAEAHEGEYRGYLTLAQVQRVMALAQGGQTLLSNATASLVSGQLPAGLTLRDLGEHRLKGLLNPQRLWQVVAPDLPQDFPVLQPADVIPNNLPVQLTSFIGREKQIAEVKQFLASARLLTLTGSGGTGKTRLSLEAAAGLLDQFPDGVWFAELAPLADPGFVAQTVASVLGVREQPGQPIMLTLTDHLRDKHLLLIVDNCEHLIAACARLADTLLHAAPHLKILASSREALNIAGELVLQVPSLPSPDPREHMTAADLASYEAVQLFVERAAAAKPGFALSSANAPAVAQICHRLDGLPLALELAAARIRAFGPEQIAARLDDRFRLLTGGSRTALPRQQTLRSTIDWSYSLLSERERMLLRRLSVFAGGWTFEAAEAVCAGEGIEVSAVLDLLPQLVEKSLVLEEEKEGETRYRMLETIRQYARDKLLEAGEGEQVRNWHLEFFVQLANMFDLDREGLEGSRWFTRLETELDNVRAAVDWSLEGRNAPAAMRLAWPLESLWFLRHPGEGIELISRILAMPEAAVRTAARARVLSSFGLLSFALPDYTTAQMAYAEALAIANEVGDEQTAISSLVGSGWAASALGDNAAARSLLLEGISRAREAGAHSFLGRAQWILGDVAFSENDFEAAQVQYEQSMATLRTAKMSTNGAPIRRLGQLALRRGDYPQAGELMRESLTINWELGASGGVAMCLAAFAALRAAEQRVIDAVRLCGAVDALLESLHTGFFPLDRILHERTLAELHNKLDATTFSAAWTDGAQMTPAQAIAYALEDSDD